MYLFDLFRSFLPLRNPIGFGVADFVALAIAVLVALLLAARAALGPYVLRIAQRTPLAMASLAGLSVLLRLALLVSSPVPMPAGADDFSYVLLADTLRHFRFANASHVLSQFFEAVFVLQHPTYSSIYPPGQGLVLALGRVLFGSYWAGVLISVAALSALCYWMLRGWTSPRWAYAGGLLAVIQFGALSAWTNSYWGGAVSACAGCLVFGALPRIAAKRDRTNVVLLGAGLAVQLLTRPFEFLLLTLCALLYVVCFVRWRRSLAFAALPLLAAFILLAIQNKSVTGSWTTLPYVLSRQQYGVPATFTFQPNPVPHRPLTQEQEFDYRAQAAIHGPDTDSFSGFFLRLVYRLRFLRFFLLAPLFASLIFVLPGFRERRWICLLVSLAIFLAGTNFYPYFFPHYIAAIASLLILLAVVGTQRLARLQPAAAVLILCLSGAHFLFWYGVHLSSSEPLLAATRYENWDFVNHGDPEGRIAVAQTLAQSADRQLVFIRYAPQHRFGTWTGNEADIDRARVVWALDLGADENQKLINYFPARRRWLLEPDARPVRLVPYPAE